MIDEATACFVERGHRLVVIMPTIVQAGLQPLGCESFPAADVLYGATTNAIETRATVANFKMYGDML
jgi:hypothetical protein